MKTTEISLTVLIASGEALFLTDGDHRYWVAKRLIPNYDPDWIEEETVDAEIPVWIAEKAGWI